MDIWSPARTHMQLYYRWLDFDFANLNKPACGIRPLSQEAAQLGLAKLIDMLATVLSISNTEASKSIEEEL